MLRPPTVTVPEAFTVVVPGTSEFTITVQVPFAAVGPVGPHVPPVMPPAPVAVDVIATPPAGLQPVPSFFSTSTVNVCGWLTWFVAVWLIVIRASTHVFT